MKKIIAILERRISGADKRAALATVVRTHGSTYRRAGARMLVEEDGTTVGLVSGGCVDSDLLARAREVMKTGIPRVISFDSGSPDSIFGYQLGCVGTIDVLLEPLTSESTLQFLEFLNRTTRLRKRSAIATVIRMEGFLSVKIADRLALDEEGRMVNTLTDPALTSLIEPVLQEILQSDEATQRRFEIADSAVEVFFETLTPPTPIALFGAGADAQPVARMAAEVGCHVTLVDHRPEFVTKSHFPSVDFLLLTEAFTMPSRLFLTERTAAVIMTHNFAHDVFYLKHLLLSPVAYIGLLGPTSKAKLLLSKLREEGVSPSEAQLARLYSPAGVDLGAETPEEIALSIIAEIQAVFRRRSGGFLRDRNAPIH